MNTKIIAIAVAATVLGGAVGFGAPFLKRVLVSVTPEASAPVTASVPAAVQASAVSVPASEPARHQSAEEKEALKTTEAESMDISDPIPNNPASVKTIKKLYKDYGKYIFGGGDLGGVDETALIDKISTPAFKQTRFYADTCRGGDFDWFYNKIGRQKKPVKLHIASTGTVDDDVSVEIGKRTMVIYYLKCNGNKCRINDMSYDNNATLSQLYKAPCN